MYVDVNTCPQFKIGCAWDADILDVMKAAKLVPGEPEQQVKIIADVPWSIDAAIRAHDEQSVFLQMAEMSDYVLRGGKNDPTSYEYVDLDDDLERPDKPPQP